MGIATVAGIGEAIQNHQWIWDKRKAKTGTEARSLLKALHTNIRSYANILTISQRGGKKGAAMERCYMKLTRCARSRCHHWRKFRKEQKRQTTKTFGGFPSP
jgi:hypothetical protein